MLPVRATAPYISPILPTAAVIASHCPSRIPSRASALCWSVAQRTPPAWATVPHARAIAIPRTAHELLGVLTMKGPPFAFGVLLAGFDAGHCLRRRKDR